MTGWGFVRVEGFGGLSYDVDYWPLRVGRAFEVFFGVACAGLWMSYLRYESMYFDGSERGVRLSIALFCTEESAVFSPGLRRLEIKLLPCNVVLHISISNPSTNVATANSCS